MHWKKCDECMKNNKLNKEKMLKELLKKCKEKNSDSIKKAFNYSFEAHKKQKRASGEPFFIHPYQTALTLAEWEMDSKTIAAGLLHDIIEDTQCTQKDMINEFGTEICELVIGTTQTDSTLSSKETIKAQALRETLIASMEKINPLIIKLADKLHNLETLQYLPEKRRKEIARAALNSYSPIAEKLGMNDVKYRIERLAFPYTNPKEFKKVMDFLKKNNPKKLLQIKKAAHLLKPLLGKMLVKFEELKRPAFITYKKTANKRELKSIYDFIVLKVIVKKKEDCYKAMGIIHRTFQPIPGKIKDFIAIPKNEFYCAIHTTVIGPDGTPLKIYIKSDEMNELSEKGILYLIEKKHRQNKFLRQKIEWIQKIQKSKPTTFKQLACYLGINGIAEKTFVFNSKGKLIELPQNFNAIDYYFLRHEEKAPYLKAVKINKKKARFNTLLKAGDIIEAEFTKKPTINERWLLLGKSPETYKKIKKALKKHSKKMEAKFYSIRFRIKNRLGMLAKFSTSLAKNNINIEDIYQEEIDLETGKKMFIYLKVKTDDKKQIIKAIKDLKKIKEIKNISKKEI
ncbi:MAG: HD domain-containing protein [Candidatus Diapherotrites archaeon]